MSSSPHRYTEKWDPTAKIKAEEEAAAALAESNKEGSRAFASKHATISKSGVLKSAGSGDGAEVASFSGRLSPAKLMVTPLILAVLEGSLKGIELLLGANSGRKKRKKYADANIPEQNSGKTALHFATKLGSVLVFLHDFAARPAFGSHACCVTPSVR
jgi:hypothetical protein